MRPTSKAEPIAITAAAALAVGGASTCLAAVATAIQHIVVIFQKKQQLRSLRRDLSDGRQQGR